MLWQDWGVVYDWMNENSIFKTFDTQLLPEKCVFWQINAAVYDFAVLRNSGSQQNRTYAP